MENDNHINDQPVDYGTGAEADSAEVKPEGRVHDSAEISDGLVHEQRAEPAVHDTAAHTVAHTAAHTVAHTAAHTAVHTAVDTAAHTAVHTAAHTPYVESQQSRESSLNINQQQLLSEPTAEPEGIRNDRYSRNEQCIQNVTSAEEFIQRFKHSLPSIVDSRLQFLPDAAQLLSNSTNSLYPYIDANIQRGLAASAPIQAPQLDDYRSRLDMINAGLFVRSSAPVVSSSPYDIPQLVKQTEEVSHAQSNEETIDDRSEAGGHGKYSPQDVGEQEHSVQGCVGNGSEAAYVATSVGGLGQASEAAAVAYAAQAVAAAVAQQEASSAHGDHSVQHMHYSQHYVPPVTHIAHPVHNVHSESLTNPVNEQTVNQETDNKEDLPIPRTVHDNTQITDILETVSADVGDASTHEISGDNSVNESDGDHYQASIPTSNSKDNAEVTEKIDLTENPKPELSEDTETKGEQPHPDETETKVEKDEEDQKITFKEEPEESVPRVTRSKSGRVKATPVKKWSKTCKCCENTFTKEEEFNHHVVVNLGKNESLLVYKCLSCCQCFDAMSDLWAHAEIHREGMQCMICDQPFHTRVELELHLSSHNCGPVLPDSIKSIEAVNGHDSDATVDNNFGDDDDIDDGGVGDGDTSGALMDDPREILKHINLDLKQEPSSDYDDMDNDPSYRSKRRKGGKGLTKYKCKYCGKRYRGQGCLKNHLRKCSADRPALTCKYCSKTFQDETNWKRHEGMHLGIRPHKCPHCDKAYSKKSHLNVHIQSHEGKKRPFPCDQCDKSFSDSHNLKRHKMRHTGERPFPCAICDKRFSDKSDLNMHQKYHLGDRPHKCPHCDKAYVKRSHLVQHMAVHSGERKFQCEYCDRAYHSAQACKRHEMTHTGEKPYQCSYCEKRFVESADRKYHEIAQHNGERPHHCPHCDKTFVRKGHLNTHLLSHKGERNFKCDTCSKAFTTSYGLKKHQLIHSGEKHLACEYCGKLFRESRNLKVHLMTHTGEKPHGCADCDKRFITAGELKMHMRVHTGEKPNTCEFCGMVFSQKGNLQRHLLRHTGERPLKCELCGKGFIEKQELNAHILNHNGLKPFKCEHCGLGFTRKHHLKKHYRTHTGYKPHTCEFCGKTFSERYNLQTHRVIHTGVKPHPCPFCSVGFIRKGHLIKHVKEAHPGQELDDSPKFYIERGPNVPNPPNLPAIINVKKPSHSQEPLPQLDAHKVDESLEPMGESSNEPPLPPPPPHAPTPSFEKQAEAAREADNNSMGGAYQQESPYRRPYLPEVELPHAYPQLHPSLMQQYGGNMANMANMAASMLPMNAATQENLINHMSRLSEMHPGAFPNPNMFPL